MIINLIALEKSPFDFSASFAPDEIDLESEEARLGAAANVSGTVTRRIAQADVAGKIAAGVEIECSRCLQTIEKSLEFPFSVAYVAPEHYTAAKETELREGDLEVALFDGEKIDIKELVREQILLNTPTQIFCSENCRGLCPTCGANRNATACDCENKEIDPRRAALKNLK